MILMSENDTSIKLQSRYLERYLQPRKLILYNYGLENNFKCK